MYDIDMELHQRDWRRSLVRPLSLFIVEKFGATHGYGIAARLEELGMGLIPSGTLYPILRKLEDEARLSSAWTAGDGGPGRKVYTITKSGISELRDFEHAWKQISTSVDGVTGDGM